MILSAQDSDKDKPHVSDAVWFRSDRSLRQLLFDGLAAAFAQ
jgi:hypothetical protein